MNFLCSNCGNKFRFDDLLIESPGLWIGCSNCGKGFFIEKKQEAVGDLSNKKLSGIEYSELKGRGDGIEKEGLSKGVRGSERSSFGENRALNISEVNGDPTDVKVDKTLEGAGFNWGRFDIKTEGEFDTPKYPELFEEDSEEIPDDSPKETLDSPRVRDTRPQGLVVDKEKLTRTKINQPYTSYNRSTITVGESRKKGSGAFRIKRFFYSIFIIIILLIIFATFMTILERLELIPKTRMKELSALIKSTLPFNVFQSTLEEIVISDSIGRWTSTRNGLIYVVSGHVTNRSNYLVSYIKIRTDFLSTGEKIYDQEVYAGNTLTENEIRTMAIEDMLLKLQRRTGDIDFYNPKKQAGLNVKIEPGESIPFYNTFPTRDKILGLKYTVDVIDFEKVDSN